MPRKTSSDYARDYDKPELREKLKEQIKASDKGGRPGQWSARKSQLLTHEYEAQGGGYKHPGTRTKSQENLHHWTEEEWQTKDGAAKARHGQTTSRYLPKKAWEKLSPEEKQATEHKKLEGSKRGQQFVANTNAAKSARKKAQS